MNWQPVAHASELARPGDFLVLPWRPDEEIALVNLDGEVVAFDNRCPHRGARIFTENRGNRPPVCAYHGRCARPGQIRHRAVRVLSGFVFASRSEVGEPDAGPVLGGFLAAAGPALQLHAELAYVMKCDWRDAVDNALDLEHVEHVHAGSLAKLGLHRAGLEGFSDGSSIEAFHARSANLSRAERLFSKTQPFDYAHAHFFPFTCLSSTKGWTWSLQHYFPRADGLTSFIHRMYVQPDGPAWFYDSAARLNEQVFAEDAAICAQLLPGFKPALGPRDDRIAHFRSYL
jgi:phenylpropionate dioxygenase-like ring-hydroxylating dioxygenase large terminal subunit